MVEAAYLAESWDLPDYRISRLLRAHADVLRPYTCLDSDNRQLLITREGVEVLAKLIGHPEAVELPSVSDLAR